MHIDEFPDELLAAVFEAGSSVRRSQNHFNKQPFPILVSQVSQHWRNVAIDMPHLWTEIKVPVFNLFGREDQEQEVLALYLDRSMPRLIDITIDCDVLHTKTKDMSPYIGLLASQACRLRSLVMESDAGVFILPFLRSFESVSMPHLESLQISLNAGLFADEAHIDALMNNHSLLSRALFGRCTQILSHLRMKNTGWFEPLICDRLTTLDLHSGGVQWSYTDFRTTLSSAPCLKNLILRGEVFALQWEEEYQAIALHSLRVLKIGLRSSNSDYATCILHVILSPALEHLELAHMEENIFPSLYVSSTATTRTKYPVLQTLRLRDVSYAPFTSDFIRHLPAISHLTLFECSLADAVFEFFERPCETDEFVGNPYALFWPDLHIITAVEVDDAALRVFLSKRISANRPIEILRVSERSLGRYKHLGELVQLQSFDMSRESEALLYSDRDDWDYDYD